MAIKRIEDPYQQALADLLPKTSFADLINQQALTSRFAALAGPSNTASGISQGSQSVAPTTNGGTTNPVGGSASAFEQFVNSIAKQESGGRYSAVNKSSGALGKYQIMPGNIASWSKSALGHSITPQQFLSNPQLQEQVARSKLQSYFNKYGASGAAQAWYGGPGSVGRNVSGGKGYPTSNQYAAAVTRRMGR